MDFKRWIRRISKSPGLPPDAPANNYPVWVLVIGLAIPLVALIALAIWLALGKPEWEWELGAAEPVVRGVIATAIAGLVVGVMVSLPGRERDTWPLWRRVSLVAVTGAGTWLAVFFMAS